MHSRLNALRVLLMKSGCGEGWLTTDGGGPVTDMTCPPLTDQKATQFHNSPLTGDGCSFCFFCYQGLASSSGGERDEASAYKWLSDPLSSQAIKLTGVFMCLWKTENSDAPTRGWFRLISTMSMVYVWAFCLKITSSAYTCRLMLTFVVSNLHTDGPYLSKCVHSEKK